MQVSECIALSLKSTDALFILCSPLIIIVGHLQVFRYRHSHHVPSFKNVTSPHVFAGYFFQSAQELTTQL